MYPAQTGQWETAHWSAIVTKASRGPYGQGFLTSVTKQTLASGIAARRTHEGHTLAQHRKLRLTKVTERPPRQYKEKNSGVVPTEIDLFETKVFRF